MTTDDDSSGQAEIMRLHYLEGLSIRAIAHQLNRDGIAARGRKWHPTTVARLLRREAA